MTARLTATTARLPIRLYPIVLALAAVGELLIVSAASPFAALRAFVAAIVIAIALSLIGRLVFGDRDRAALFAAIGIGLIMAGRDPRAVVAVAVAVGLLLMERYLVPPARRTIEWPRVSRVAAALTAVLVLAMLIQAIQLGTPQRFARAAIYQTALRPAVTTTASPSDPDIYLIMLDGHARADVLKEVFDVDGAAFVDALEQRGFAVSAQSRSDYEVTVHTLSSMFNMAMLPAIDRLAPTLAGELDPPPGGVYFDVINDNAVFANLRARGYEIDSIGSGYEEVAMREADRFVDTGQLNEFEIGMLRRTVFGNLLRVVAPDFVSAQQRSRIQGILDETVVLASESAARPRLLFAHVPSPHPPWVFHADGSPRTVPDLTSFFRESPEETGLTGPELEDGYKGQVADIDRKLLATLDRLEPRLHSGGRPAVVIVFSDHGTWIGATGDDRGRRDRNLLAVRSTEANVTFGSDETLVDVFPSMFEQLFGPGWRDAPTGATGP